MADAINCHIELNMGVMRCLAGDLCSLNTFVII